MVVWFAHVRVGHRQLPIPKPPPLTLVRGVLLWGFPNTTQDLDGLYLKNWGESILMKDSTLNIYPQISQFFLH